jgi:hypothetical protein
MIEEALIESLNHPALRGVETLPVGSAKVPHLPYLTDIIQASDAAAVTRALHAERERIEAFSDVLRRHGYTSMSKTIDGCLAIGRRDFGDALHGKPAKSGRDLNRLNSAQRSLLEWIYAATFKTAGLSTMEFVPWVRSEEESQSAVWPRLLETSGGLPYVGIPSAVLSKVAEANKAIYELAVGALNGAHSELLADAGSEVVIERALSMVAQHQEPRFVRPTDAKSMLKIDYKIGRAGDLIMVDLNAGTIGAHFDDLLLDELGAEVAPEEHRVAQRQAAAVFTAYVATKDRWPRSMAVTVLDERMFELWHEADLAGLTDRLREFAEVNGYPVPQVPVITMAALKEYADTLDDALMASQVLNDAEWRRPDLIVAYSWGTTHADRAVYARLRDAGIVMIDDGHHSFVAAKEFAVDQLFCRVSPEGLSFPPTVTIGTVDGLLEGGDASAAVWEVAEEAGWGAVAVKTQKVRRTGGRGDLPSAMIYPVTAVGRQVAGRLHRLYQEVAEAGGGRLLVTASRVELGGGLVAADGTHRDVELRTYAFPVIPRRGS